MARDNFDRDEVEERRRLIVNAVEEICRARKEKARIHCEVVQDLEDWFDELEDLEVKVRKNEEELNNRESVIWEREEAVRKREEALERKDKKKRK